MPFLGTKRVSDLMTDSILIVGPAWVGDMVMAQSLFMRLKQLRPECEIDVLAPAWSLPLLTRMPQVRSGIEMPLGHGALGLGLRRRLGHSLRAKNYAQAIVLPNSWKSALTPFFADIPRRTGFRGEMRFGLLNDIRPLDKSQLTTSVQRFVALAEDSAVNTPPPMAPPKLKPDAANRTGLLRRLDLDVHRPVVALMPGAEYGPAKQWPAEYFAALARMLHEQGVACWVFGSAKESDLGERIRDESGAVAVNLCGLTTLTDVIDLVSGCRAVVSNDSGLMHIAAASGVPVAAIYGSSSPEHTPPLTERKAIHWLHLSCAPCFERTCPLGHTNCLKQIAPVAVFESLRGLQAL